MKSLNKISYFSLSIFIFFTFSSHVFAAVSYTAGSTAQQLADQIQGVGITITNPVITVGADQQRAVFFNGTDEGLEVDEGILLTCMSADESFTTNNSGGRSVNASAGTYNDTDLVAIDANAVNDVIVFEFDVTLDDNTRLLLIDYQFASEEYNEYVGSRFNDAFGFFISGGDLNQTYNIARVVDNQTFVTIDNIANYPAVTVNNVNNGAVGVFDDATPEDLTNSAFFIDNTGGAIDVEYDGLTVTLHAALDNLTPGVTYHFKMALADTGDSAWDTGVFINKINGLREPSICYDYAYKQNGQYISNDYNASTGPVLTGNIIADNPNYPVEVSMYIKNLQDSEIVASNIKFDVFDLNTSQATYKTESVSVIETGELYKTKIDDVDLNVSNNYVKDIPITSFNAFEYFYAYFSLDPIVEDLNLPIYSRITYDLTLPISATQSVTLNRSSLIDTDVPICSTDSVYQPTPGIFSIVHNDYYELDINPSSTKKYYNIPTQVTSREGNFKVVSLDVNNTDQLVGRSTIVAVEMVDISAFHDTDASCNEQSNAISEKIWVTLDNNATSTMFDRDALFNAIGLNNTMTSSAEFYALSRKNAAFRLSYNVTDDGNDDLVKIEELNNTYKILNFPEVVQVVGECARPVVYPLNANNTGIATRAAQACGNSGNFISFEHLQACMECIYGYNTRFVCSRDNFAIRPEAFLIHIDDQDQTNPTSQQRLTTGYSGVSSATASEINIAANYKYNIEVNATNHLNNTSSVGYIKSFDSSLNSSDTSQYIWEPRGLTSAQLVARNAACNDDANKSVDITFYNGSVDTNTSADQVGEYRLNILDRTWTTVDSNPAFMTHHTGAYFNSALDCTIGSSVTYPVNSTIDLTNATTLSSSLTGCNISSSHTGPSSSLVYNDYNIEFHPYTFNVLTDVRIGEENITPPLNDAFIYMANIDQDENMSVQINTFITAIGKDNPNAKLENFVTGCYAKSLDINITKSITQSDRLENDYSFRNYDSNRTFITTDEVNATIQARYYTGVWGGDLSVTALSTYFQKDLNGTIDTTTRFNFNRENNETANPEKVTFYKYNVENPNDRFAADLNISNMAEGFSDINKSTTQNLDVTHFYGRTASRKTTIICDTALTNCTSGGTEPDVFIYYEVFCHDTLNANTCDPTLLPTDASGSSQQKVDRRWFISLDHNLTNDGNLTNSVDSINNAFITFPNGITHSNSYTVNSQHSYAISNGLPYTANMDDTVPRWLVYDENNASATLNHHTVIFRPRTEWTGAHEDDSKTTTDRVRRVNRRTMW